MGELHTFYYLLDLAGTFAFAISGATAARERRLDLFGICAVAFTVACGGGITRDLCIGAIPPAGLTNWYYLATAMFAAIMTIWLYPIVKKIKRPVILFDAAGLALFAVTGAQKSLAFGHNAEVAILLGIVTAVGGGILRDVLLNRVPVVLEREIYASAALLGALIVVLGALFNWLTNDWISIIAIIVAFSLRMLALRYHWNLPIFSNK
ncbi:MAG: trimeric intracellular cation channel family protein [Proteiniphilum sp.]